MKKTKNAAILAALVGMMAATLECAKLSLAAIPNVEAVSLLIAVYSTVFGYLGVLAALIFVMIEPLVWGFGPWLVSYVIYWPTLALVFAALGRAGVRLGRIRASLLALFLTLLFGIISALVDLGLFTGYWDNFFKRLSVYYLGGVGFYITHVVSNTVIFAVLYNPLCRLLSKIKSSFFV